MVKQRNEIDEKYQWDLSTNFATDQAWEEEAASLAADIKAASPLCWPFVGFSANTIWIQPMHIWN